MLPIIIIFEITPKMLKLNKMKKTSEKVKQKYENFVKKYGVLYDEFKTENKF